MPNSTLALPQHDSHADESAKAIAWHRPLLVGCCPSSGSTLLSVMLDAHPEVMCGPELSLLAHPFVWQGSGERWRTRLLAALQSAPLRPADPWNFACGAVPYAPPVDTAHLAWYGLDLDALCGLVRRSDGIEELLQGMLGPALRRTGKRIWAEKSPPNLYALPDFLDRFPEGRAVVVVRDGRDVVCSLMKRGFSLAEASSIWLVEAALCKQLGSRPNVHLLRYEDLVVAPERTIETMLASVDLMPATEAMLHYAEHTDRAESDDSIRVTSWTQRPTGGIRSGSVGRWQRDLSAAQLELFYRHELKNVAFRSAKAAYFCGAKGDHSTGEAGMTTVNLLAGLGYDPPQGRSCSDSALCEAVQRERLFSERAAGFGRFHRDQTRVRLDAESLLQLATVAQTSLDDAEVALAQSQAQLQTNAELLTQSEHSRAMWEENWRVAQHQVDLLEIALQNSFGNRMRRKLKALRAWFSWSVAETSPNDG